MTKASLLLAALCCTAGIAHAGPNANGTILFHSNPDIQPCEGDYCGHGGLTACEGARVNAPPTEPGGGPVLSPWFAYVNFPGGSSPRLSVITFGLSDYDPDGVFILNANRCADGELPTTTPPWPMPGSGNAVQWNEPRTSRLVEFYWFAGYGYTGEFVGLAPHPTQGGTLTDDAVPAHTDQIVGYGSMGFGVDGQWACPMTMTGACCLPGGSCLIVTQAECDSLGGTSQGPGTSCVPNPCPGVFGACCLPTGCCQVMTQAECDSLLGDWLGPETNCVPSPCSAPPGACCLQDGSCQFTDSCTCSEVGGTFLGGQSCDPNPCQEPTGACCLEPMPECRILTRDQCAAQQGFYQGDGTLCEPNPCPVPTPTRKTTWGQIKHLYR